MRPDFNIGARNGLIDQKHMEAMGQAIWLYLWFLDKQPKESDKVLGGQPITFEMVAESYTGMSRRTYANWTAQLVKGSYISLTRTPRGLIVTIEKSKKWDKTATQKTAHRKKSDMQKVAHQAKSDVQDFTSDVQNRVTRYAEIGTSNIRATRSNTQQQLLSTVVDSKASADDTFKEQVSKLYYEAIKALDLPVRNHTTVKSAISKFAQSPNPGKVLNYLMFVRDRYEELDVGYKPHLNEALDIYGKWKAIENAMKRDQKEEVEARGIRL